MRTLTSAYTSTRARTLARTHTHAHVDEHAHALTCGQRRVGAPLKMNVAKVI